MSEDFVKKLCSSLSYEWDTWKIRGGVYGDKIFTHTPSGVEIELAYSNGSVFVYGFWSLMEKCSILEAALNCERYQKADKAKKDREDFITKFCKGKQ